MIKYPSGDTTPLRKIIDGNRCNTSKSYGGSANTTSNAARGRARNSNTSVAITSHSEVPPTRAMFFLKYSTARFEFSTNTTRRAPRLEASIPKLPLPANKSSACTSVQSTLFCKILNTELLTLLVAGRTDKSGTVRNDLPLYLPAMTRILIPLSAQGRPPTRIPAR